MHPKTIRRPQLLLAMTLVLAVAVAAPTIGSNKRSVAEIAREAHIDAKAAKRIAETAKRKAVRAGAAAATAGSKADAAEVEADQAGLRADQAGVRADQAGARADAVGARLDALGTRSATVAGTVSTANETEYQDLGGPRVTVTVPESGLIEVWAQVAIADGSVSIYEDGQQLANQDPNGICDGPAGALLSFPTTPAFVVSTPGTFSFAGCGNTGAPAASLFETTPGQHTYELRYADCGCDPADAEFSDRLLMVAPRP
jgi:hypothetical protein